MRHFHWKKAPQYCPTVNVERLASMIPQEDKAKGGVPVVNLTQHGIFKILGKGGINTPVIVKARFVSRIAEKKIKEAGGTCVLVA